VVEQTVTLEYISIKEKIIDIFTKPLTKEKIAEGKLGIVPSH